MITVRRLRRIERALELAGHADDIAWAEHLQPPTTAAEFAGAAIYVIVNSGMSFTAARPVFARCMRALKHARPVRRVFRHRGKTTAIERIWKDREELFAGYLQADDKLKFCESLPWIGPITKHHLARDLGVDVAKPDVHLARLARHDRTTVERMCRRLARETGYRVATVDTILWRACATGILDSRRYEAGGWRCAFHGRVRITH